MQRLDHGKEQHVTAASPPPEPSYYLSSERVLFFHTLALHLHIRPSHCYMYGHRIGAMKSISLFLLTLLFSLGYGWTNQPRATPSLVRISMSSPDKTDDPCWQDLYDDDCSMSSVYAASFVAGKWIKSMPCASGLDEDCDMGNLDVPDARPEAGVDNVDVMDFLGLKKAESLKKPEDDATP